MPKIIRLIFNGKLFPIFSLSFTDKEKEEFLSMTFSSININIIQATGDLASNTPVLMSVPREKTVLSLSMSSTVLISTNKRSIGKKAPFTIHFLFAWKKLSQILDTSKDIGHIVLVPSPHKLHYTALLTLYIVSVCGHPCGIIGAHAQSHIPSGHWQCLHVWCPMSHAMPSLVSCLQLAIYTLHQTQLHKKTIFQEKKDIPFFSLTLCL